MRSVSKKREGKERRGEIENVFRCLCLYTFSNVSIQGRLPVCKNDKKSTVVVGGTSTGRHELMYNMVLFIVDSPHIDCQSSTTIFTRKEQENKSAPESNYSRLLELTFISLSLVYLYRVIAYSSSSFALNPALSSASIAAGTKS